MNKHSEILAALSAPFPPEVIRHRTGAGGKDLTWVDARTVAARLDEVLGVNAWDFAVEPVGDTNTVVGILTCRFPDGTVARRQDFGYETGGSGESLKEAASDALRRCASLFGVARYLYGGEKPAAGRVALPPLKPMSLPQTPVPAQQGHDTVVLKAAMAMFGNDNCPDHGQPWTLKPGGVSKATGKPYAPFWACSGRTDGAFCKKKPSIDFINSQAAPLGEPVKTEEDLSELPF
jgi:hypothetical protein